MYNYVKYQNLIALEFRSSCMSSTIWLIPCNVVFRPNKTTVRVKLCMKIFCSKRNSFRLMFAAAREDFFEAAVFLE